MVYYFEIIGKDREGYKRTFVKDYWDPVNLNVFRMGLVDSIESYSSDVYATVYTVSKRGNKRKIGTITVSKKTYPWTAYWTTDKGKARITKSGALAKAPKGQYGIKGKLRPFGL